MTRSLLLALSCVVALGLSGCDAVAPAETAEASTATALASPTLSSTHNGNLAINLSWTSVAGATSYSIERINTGLRGTLADGITTLGNTLSAGDCPYEAPEFDEFAPNQIRGFACYRITAHGSGQSSTSNTVCYGVQNHGGGGF